MSAPREWLERALEFHRAGDLPAAEQLYERILSVDANHPDAWHLSGVIAAERGDLERAETCIRRALELNSGHEPAHYNLGELLRRQRKWAAAAAAYECALRCDSNSVEALSGLGDTLRAMGHLDEAVARGRQAVARDPRLPLALTQLARTLREAGQTDESDRLDEEALRLAAESPAGLLAVAAVFEATGRHAFVVEACRRILQRQPQHLLALGRLSAALAELHQLEPAEQACASLLAIDPRHVNAWARRSRIALRLERASEAFEFAERALELQPRSAAFRVDRALALAALGRWSEARACLADAIELRPDYAMAHSTLLFLANYAPDLNVDELWRMHRRFGELHDEPAAIARPFDHERDPHRRLRIGFISPNIHDHPVATFLEPWLMHADRTGFEIVLYCDVGIRDTTGRRLRVHADRVRDVEGKTNDEVELLIRADGIDLLIDLAGHSASNRLPLFARKCAPLQASWLGYPNTTGLRSIDYRLTDAIADPPGEPVRHSEELLRIEGGFACYRPRDDAPPVAPSPASATGHVTFGSLHHSARLNDGVLALWAEVLRRVANSRLLIARENLRGPRRAELDSRLRAHHLDPARYELLGDVAGACGHLETYSRIDVTLDTFPWSGHTTACDSLWMGVPVITLRGDRHAGRMVSSVLTSAGFPQWIGATPERYVELAAGIASDLPRLAELRGELRAHLSRSRLCDGSAFTKSAERALRNAWQCWCRKGAGPSC